MERRSFLRFSLLSLLTLGIKGAKPLLASPDEEALGMKAPVLPWEKVEFSFAIGPQTYPGIAIRLPKKPDFSNANPAGNGEIYAVCRICPHQGCSFNYETNYEKIGGWVGLDLKNPVFFCRCHMSVFDPAQKGRVLFGPADRPPWLFFVQEQGQEMIITGAERGIGQIG